MSADQVEHIAAVAGGTVGPEPRLVAVEHDLQAVARAAEHVADDELAAARPTGGNSENSTASSLASSAARRASRRSDAGISGTGAGH
ncbi:hypothetical protein [Aerosticca soli]|uniref:hypothetical protein n=1 Tax=Aerosticca soli TaxID=2010829 RepID=UPI001386DF11|nr:hypothetical protein [Aerosticca soli]